MKFAQLCDRVETQAGEIDQAALLGTWINSNLETNSIARVKISENDGKPELQVFAMGPDGVIDWGPAPAQVFAAGPASHAGVGFTCRYDFGFAEARLQAMIMKGLLVLAQFHLFKDDSGRADYFLREYFALSHDRF
jgi:hypothetical protein